MPRIYIFHNKDKLREYLPLLCGTINLLLVDGLNKDIIEQLDKVVKKFKVNGKRVTLNPTNDLWTLDKLLKNCVYYDTIGKYPEGIYNYFMDAYHKCTFCRPFKGAAVLSDVKICPINRRDEHFTIIFSSIKKQNNLIRGVFVLLVVTIIILLTIGVILLIVKPF